jgi:hypothetical protein
MLIFVKQQYKNYAILGGGKNLRYDGTDRFFSTNMILVLETPSMKIVE